MERRVAIWLDHRSAKLMELEGSEVSVREFESDVESRVKSTGGTRVPGRHYLRSASGHGSHLEHRRQHELGRYYHRLAQEVAGADEVLIWGPGTAKEEFARFLAARPRPPDMATDTMERLTLPQLKAKVRAAFG